MHIVLDLSLQFWNECSQANHIALMGYDFPIWIMIGASVEIRTEWSSNIADSFSVLKNTTYVTVSKLELYVVSVSNIKLNVN